MTAPARLARIDELQADISRAQAAGRLWALQGATPLQLASVASYYSGSDQRGPAPRTLLAAIYRRVPALLDADQEEELLELLRERAPGLPPLSMATAEAFVVGAGQVWRWILRETGAARIE